MAKQPLGQYPRVVPLQDEEGNATRQWGQWLEQVRANLYDVRDFKLTLDPSSVGATTTSEESFTANEIATDDAILSINKPTDTTGLFVANARAGDQKLFLTFANVTSSSIDPPSEDYLVTILKR